MTKLNILFSRNLSISGHFVLVLGIFWLKRTKCSSIYQKGDTKHFWDKSLQNFLCYNKPDKQVKG